MKTCIYYNVIEVFSSERTRGIFFHTIEEQLLNALRRCRNIALMHARTFLKVKSSNYMQYVSNEAFFE